MKIGIGYDIHRLVKGRKLLLGGVHITHPKGLLGHSDGDVLLHALVDAVLGAMGEGDIGRHFPSGDPRWKGADSAVFIRKAAALLKKNRLKIVNIDAVIVAESPRLSGHMGKMNASVAKLFRIENDKVNVKAKTNEGLDAVGRGEAIACWAAVSLKR